MVEPGVNLFRKQVWVTLLMNVRVDIYWRNWKIPIGFEECVLRVKVSLGTKVSHP